MTDATRRKRAKLSEVAVTGSAAAQSSTPRSKTLVVAVYNFKGGCGKTFLTRELAATAVKAGKRVGMVDIDPQCNLTSWWLPGTEPYMGDGVDTAKRRDSDDEEEDSGNESDDCEEAGEQVGAQGAAVAPQVQQVNAVLIGCVSHKMRLRLCCTLGPGKSLQLEHLDISRHPVTTSFVSSGALMLLCLLAAPTPPGNRASQH